MEQLLDTATTEIETVCVVGRTTSACVQFSSRCQTCEIQVRYSLYHGIPAPANYALKSQVFSFTRELVIKVEIHRQHLAHTPGIIQKLSRYLIYIRAYSLAERLYEIYP